MKKVRKTFILTLVVIALFAIGIPVFAVNENTKTYSSGSYNMTIHVASELQKYTKTDGLTNNPIGGMGLTCWARCQKIGSPNIKDTIGNQGNFGGSNGTISSPVPMGYIIEDDLGTMSTAHGYLTCSTFS